MITSDSKNITVAGDSYFHMAKLSDILIGAGHAVTAVDTFKDIVNEIKKYSTAIHLLILDFQIPDVNGLSVLRWIHENGYKGRFPLIGVSGAYESTQNLKSMREFGVAGFISKNFPPEQILFRVNTLLFSDKIANGVPRRRVPTSIPVDFTFGNITNTVVIINIGEGGAFIHTTVKFPEAAMLDIKFSLPGTGKIMNVKGTVRWFSLETIPQHRIFCGCGIIFTSLLEGDKRALKNFIDNEIAKVDMLNNMGGNIF